MVAEAVGGRRRLPAEGLDVTTDAALGGSQHRACVQVDVVARLDPMLSVQLNESGQFRQGKRKDENQEI